jgi:hypothetical protein
MFSNIILDAGISIALLDSQLYIVFVGFMRCDFGASKNTAVPYIC